jgi:hypothetical protein
MGKKPKRPKDTNQRAKLLVDILTGEGPSEGKGELNPIRSKAGKKGGKARASKLSKEKRKEIAKKAAEKRWKK